MIHGRACTAVLTDATLACVSTTKLCPEGSAIKQCSLQYTLALVNDNFYFYFLKLQLFKLRLGTVYQAPTHKVPQCGWSDN